MNGVVRFEKYHKNDVVGIQREQNRKIGEASKFAYSSIDDDRIKDNKFFARSSNWNEKIKTIMSKYDVKARKDSVVLVGAIITASKEYFTQNEKYKEPPIDGKDDRTEEEKRKWIYDDKLDSFCNDSIRTFVKTMCQGQSDRVVSCKLDLDEDTPHLHIYFVPIHKEKDRCSLSAKKLMNGRQAMRDIQNQFFDNVFKKRGFERGEMVDWNNPENKKYHTRTIDYKKQQNKTLEKECAVLTAQKDELLQKLGEYSKRLEKLEKEALEMEKAVDQVYDFRDLESFIDKASVNHAQRGKTAIKDIFEDYKRILSQKNDKAYHRPISQEIRKIKEEISQDFEEYGRSL